MMIPPLQTACSGFRENHSANACKHGFFQNRGCLSSSVKFCGCRVDVPPCLTEEAQPKIKFIETGKAHE